MDVDKTDTSLCETLSVDQLKGSLAESWEVSDDFTTMTVKLRQGVNFADKTAVGIDAKYDIYGGRALTAADVKYSYDRVLGLDGVEKVVMDQTNWAGSLYMVDSVEAPDDQTVIFHFNTNNEVQVNNFMITVLNICGPEWDQLTDEQKTDYHYAGGTGAFILTDYVSDNTMTFVANPNYWEKDADGNQLPYLGTIKLVHMSDTATMLSSFIGGDLQALMANNFLIDRDQASQLKDGTYTKYTYSNDCPAVCGSSWAITPFPLWPTSMSALPCSMPSTPMPSPSIRVTPMPTTMTRTSPCSHKGSGHLQSRCAQR